ncbi:MAG TPA: FHA domain-containing protein [Gaiellaceae bacterium]|nr:FHA domain-containing protein [Gaiellaceae bacterium]
MSVSIEPVLLALQAAFVVLLYLFIWRVVRSAVRGLPAAPQESFVLAPAQVAQARHEAGVRSGKLVVVRSQALPLGQAIEAGPVPTTIGRGQENTVVLDGDEYASGQHARVESGLDGTWVVDLGSTNGTYVNGERVEGRRRLHEGDLLQVGDTELRFER